MIKDMISNEIIFTHEAGFRINQMNILSKKYNIDITELYEAWREFKRCSFIKLELIIKMPYPQM